MDINRKRRKSKLVNMTPEDIREWNEQTTLTRGISKLKYTDIWPTEREDDGTILLDRNNPDHVEWYEDDALNSNDI
ncbi:hypothetical protein [Alicyclobacillus acidoterrestris]|uniref:Uncharacterized protein n=1 Tax=Alicyclobacillus acidoterrestris (strain ATCC 49025 / DSM 3922 / CIP 106132 / NCIMB 13137 / GD3B) TaxID=1356854 RepID=T0BUD5_ALIAG|nr:hypothetical protein [Alicyclobacillus acidoterrestris]EPZ47703.1 hypothetical protein N007_05465 [Alicyclobacillus acidoterrestris ATCC 49025]UNO47982.1 hypothetical protein K1I37_15010 [Alicyclobacillus acidoterrestris]